MRSIDTFRQHIWLINTIRRARRISYNDIKKLVMLSKMVGDTPDYHQCLILKKQFNTAAS